MSSSQARPIEVTILVDNNARSGLRAEHGLSLWIEAGGRRLLFDTGQGSALPANARTLGIDLRATDILLLSHGHYDHTGAVPYVLETSSDVHVYCHPAAKSPRYAVSPAGARAIDMPSSTRTAITELGPSKLHWMTHPVELLPGIGVTGPIPRRNDYEDTGGPFYLDEAGRRADPIDDDIALWLRTERGLVVIVGCCHAGLTNTLTYARQLSQCGKVHAVIGGLHLLQASDRRLKQTIGALDDLRVDLVVPCHCTGAGATARLREALGERVSPGEAGATYTFSPTGGLKLLGTPRDGPPLLEARARGTAPGPSSDVEH